MLSGRPVLPNTDFFVNTDPTGLPIWPLLFITIACGAEAYMASMIASRSYSLFSGKQYSKLICARRRELFARRPTRRPSLPRSGSRKDGGVSAIPAKAKTPSQAPQ